MRVALLSKALVVAAYRSKLMELDRAGVEVVGLAPSKWVEEGRAVSFEPAEPGGGRTIQIPMAWNGHFHLHYYPALRRVLRSLNPDIVHVDEEPYNLATYLAFRDALAASARPIFFAWQNIARRYPPPFEPMESWVYRHSPFALAGSEAAASVLREKGYGGEITVRPQFGVDLSRFTPRPSNGTRFSVGYVGRLVQEKGIADLIAAFERLPPPARLIIAGEGPLAGYVETATASLRQQGRCERYPRLPSSDVPALLQRLDVVVLPSRTTSRWREQFGRVLIEAMACEVAVVGSDSGEIPGVIGDAGLIYPEGDVEALAARLTSLMVDGALRRRLAATGRARAEERYSQAAVAVKTVEVYRRMMEIGVEDWTSSKTLSP